MKKDNDGIRAKKTLRRRALDVLGVEPIVIEGYAGEGALYEELYAEAPPGVAIEKDEAKAKFLADQRPTWRVYQGDSVEAIRQGLADDVAFNFVDADPYGDPWPFIMAFLRLPRERADRPIAYQCAAADPSRRTALVRENG